jgi:hypothetical protein
MRPGRSSRLHLGTTKRGDEVLIETFSGRFVPARGDPLYCDVAATLLETLVAAFTDMAIH